MESEISEVDGQAFLVIPEVILSELQLQCGSWVDFRVEKGQLLIKPLAK